MARSLALSPVLRDRFHSEIIAALANPGAEMLGVDAERINEWIDATWQVSEGDPGLMSWYIRRLGGIASSEIGVAVAEFIGEVDPFANCRQIISNKLLLTAPERATFAMQVGALFKPAARRALHGMYGEYGCKSDERALGLVRRGETVTGEPVERSRPWLQGGPDDVVLINGRRYVVGYKVLLNDRDPLETSTRYVYQMHHDRLVMQDHGIEIDGMILAKYRRDENGFAELVPLVVDFDQDKENVLLASGDHLWEMRNQRFLPDVAVRRQLHQIGETGSSRELLDSLAEQFAAYDAIAASAYAKAARVKEQIADKLRGLEIPAGTTGFGAVSVLCQRSLNIPAAVRELGQEAEKATRPAFSASKMQAWLERNGVDMRQFQEPGAYSESALKTMLLARKLDPEAFMSANLSIASDRSGNALGKALKRAAQAQIDDIKERILPMAAQAARGEEVPVTVKTPRKTVPSNPAM